MQSVIKDPDAILDYDVDWSRWLGTDTISSVVWVVGTGLTKDSQSNTDTVAKVWLSGGTVGTNYSVTCRVTTAGGRTDDRSFQVKVRER